jgi:hypothetical protein
MGIVHQVRSPPAPSASEGKVDAIVGSQGGRHHF